MEKLLIEKNIEKLLKTLTTKEVNSRAYNKFYSRLLKKLTKLKKIRRVRYNSTSIEKMFSFQNTSEIEFIDSIKGNMKKCNKLGSQVASENI